MDDALFALTLLAALGCGLVGGIFFVFSAFIMKALARIPPPQGIAAMQSINIVVLNPWFLAPFLGTAAACVLLIVFALVEWGESDALYWLIGSVLYLVGTTGVTMVFNVPRNNVLAAVDADSTDGAARWTQYVSSWTTWNTVRTVAAVAAAVAFTLALVVGQ